MTGMNINFAFFMSMPIAQNMTCDDNTGVYVSLWK